MCTSPVLPTPFIEETAFAPLYACASFVKYQSVMQVWVYSWALCLVPLVYVSVLMPVPGSFCKWPLFFFPKIAEAIQGIFWLHVNFWNICYSSVNCAIGILMGIVLNV